jgi:uncharacterized protein Yka (UPF0111/DUF47 family)
MTIFERTPIGNLFGKTPFKPLHSHILQVKECTELLKPLIEAFIAGDYEKIEAIVGDIVNDLRLFADTVIASVAALEKSYSEIDRLMETGFGDREREIMLDLIKEVDKQEWKADEIQLKMTKKLFDIENNLDPITLFFLMRIINEMDAVADYAEDSGDQMRTMLAK